MSQASLFDATTKQPGGDAPRCRMCARPARWQQRQQSWAMYCAGSQCSNRERLCQKCSQPFNINVDGAGTKYCSTRCKIDGYKPTTVGFVTRKCAWCKRAAPASARPNTRGWPFICTTCLDPIRHLLSRLKKHHVPHDRARRLRDDPGCEVCSVDIVAKSRNPTTGKVRSRLVVDHDHGCCPGTTSCGRCVRGLLCDQCNSAAGLLKDNPEIAQSLAVYLDR